MGAAWGSAGLLAVSRELESRSLPVRLLTRGGLCDASCLAHGRLGKVHVPRLGASADRSALPGIRRALDERPRRRNWTLERCSEVA